MWGSSSAWSAQTSGSSPSCPGAGFGFGQTTGFAPWGWLFEKGSRVFPFKKTAEDSPNKEAGFYNGYFQSISAMPFYSNKSHEELRYEDYQIRDKGGVSLRESLFNPAPMVPVSSPPSMEQPSTVLQPSTQGPNCSPNPFWLPSVRLQSPSSTMTKATFWPTFSISTSPPTARQKIVFSNSAAAYVTPAEAGTSSSAAHSEPSLSPDAHCTNITVDYPNNAIELLLPSDISLVKIRFSSQAHSDRVATASETPISLSLYHGENEELIIQSIERPRNQSGKQCRSTAGSCPNDEVGNVLRLV